MRSRKTPQSSTAGALLLAILVAGVALSACTPADPAGDRIATPTSILLITIDTLRADHLGTYGYIRDTSPRLDTLAEESLLFERAITPMATTLPAHLSIMTSTHPARHGVIKNGLRFEPTAECLPLSHWMKGLGYETAAFVSAVPVGRETGIDAGFDLFVQPEGPIQRGEVTVESFFAWLDARKDAAREDADAPFFVWIHLWDPHAPYEPPEPYASMFGRNEELRKLLARRGVPLIAQPSGLGSEQGLAVDAEILYNAYDGEVRYTDDQLGRILDRLKAEGLYDDLALVLASDHGEGLLQHGVLDHGQIFDEQLWVPLLIKPPAALGIEPRRIGGVVSTVDVVPTLTALLSLDLGDQARAQFMGIDRLGPTERSDDYVVSERAHRQRRGWEPGDKYALTGPKWRSYVLPEDRNLLFDLEQDPHELENVRDQNPGVAEALEKRLLELLGAYRTEGGSDRRDVGGEHEERLKALGYLG